MEDSPANIMAAGFRLVSLFKGILTFVCYLMPKLSLLSNWGNIFLKGVRLKVNVTVELELSSISLNTMPQFSYKDPSPLQASLVYVFLEDGTNSAHSDSKGLKFFNLLSGFA